MILRFASSIEEQAIEYFGLTDSPYEAGFILSDGRMLDFSGANQGSGGGSRYLDHREIGFLDVTGGEAGDDEYTGSGWSGVVAFMARGHIRFSFHSGDMVNIGMIVEEPTYQQQRVITEIIRDAQGYSNGVDIYIDIYDLVGSRLDSIEIQNSFFPTEWLARLRGEDEEDEYE